MTRMICCHRKFRETKFVLLGEISDPSHPALCFHRKTKSDASAVGEKKKERNKKPHQTHQLNLLECACPII